MVREATVKTHDPDETERLHTPEEVAEILVVPKETLYKWRLAGEGPPALRDLESTFGIALQTSMLGCGPVEA